VGSVERDERAPIAWWEWQRPRCLRTSFSPLSLDANTVELTMRCLTVLVASMQFVLLYARPAVPEWLRIASRRNDREEEVPSSQGADEDRLAMYIYAVNNASITDISTRELGPLNAPTYVRQCSRRRNGCV